MCRSVRVLALLSTIIASAPAATYYVNSAGGNNGNDGLSWGTAWRDFAKVNSVTLQPGDRVLFRMGQTFTGKLEPKGSGTPSAPIVFGSYGNAGEPAPILNANLGEEAIRLRNLSNIVIENLRITNPSTNINRIARGIFILADAANCDNITIRNNEIYHIDGHVLQVNRGRCGAILYESNTGYRLNNLLIHNNLIRDITVRGISGYGDSPNWRDYNAMNDGLTIRNNTIENTGCDAIRAITFKNILVEYNRIYEVGANTRGVEASYIAAAFPQQAGDSVWQFNEIAYTAPTAPTGGGDLDSQAFDIDHDCVGTHIFQYNYTHNNAGGFALFMGDSVDAGLVANGSFTKGIFRYNVSVNDGVASNRLIETHGFGSRVFDLQFYNNTFYYTSGTMGIQVKGTPVNGLVFRNNIFRATASNFPTNVGAVYDTNIYSGFVAPHTDAGRIQYDPLFASPGTTPEGMSGADGYKVTAGSPATAAGVIISSNGGRDFWNNSVPSSEAPTIGAHQITPNWVRIRNRWQTNRFLYDGGQYALVGTSNNTSYHWLEISLNGYVRLRNRATGSVLTSINSSTTNPYVECIPAIWDSHSAMWTVEVNTSSPTWWRLRNRTKTDQYLHIENRTTTGNKAQLSTITDSMWSAQWQYASP